MFKKIVIVEPIYIAENGKKELQKYCDELVIYDTNVTNEDETIKRIGNADCILVSVDTIISKKIIENCANLKHISLCCSFYGKQFAKVDIDTVEKNGITYSYLSEYGDNGTVEYVVAQTINLIHGLYGIRLKEEAYDLTGIKVGILGLGGLGTKIAKAFRIFDTDVYYYSRTRKENIENQLDIKYLELDELFNTVDVISINLNRDVCLIGSDNLKKFSNGKVIINTAIGKCYEIDSLKEWLKNKNNYYISDSVTSDEDIKELSEYGNVIYSNLRSGVTRQTLERATQQIIDNIKNACML